MKLFKLLNTLLTITANTMTVAMFAFIIYVILGGWWAMVTDPDYATRLNQPATTEIVHHA